MVPSNTDEETADQLHSLGNVLHLRNHFIQALDYYNRALTIKPDFAVCLNSKGFALQDLGEIKAARTCFSLAVELDPKMTMARLNLAMAQLKLGDFARGWENYEARWAGAAEAYAGEYKRPQCSLPQWSGESDTLDKRLLVITEQGFGDTFQFSRYLPLAAKRFSKVGFVCTQQTLRLMEWAYGEEVVILGGLSSDYEAWDYHCPLMSLPRAFATRIDTIPCRHPILRVPKTRVAHWTERLEISAPASFRIGIAWSGSKTNHYDSRRSLKFNQLIPLFFEPCVTWVSLQKLSPDEKRPDIPADIDWIDWSEEFTDFADTAALVAGLDLILSIDSAIVHLAGSLNRPVWMLDRYDNEWRWLHNREDSPWYPTLRIFRQSEWGDWDGVISRVCDALRALRLPQSPVRNEIK